MILAAASTYRRPPTLRFLAVSVLASRFSRHQPQFGWAASRKKAAGLQRERLAVHFHRKSVGRIANGVHIRQPHVVLLVQLDLGDELAVH